MLRLLTDTYTVWRRELVKLLNDPGHLAITIIRPLLLIFLVGKGLDAIVDLPETRGNYIGFVGPGMVAVLAVTASMQVGASLIRDRDGSIKTILIAPISRLALLLGKILGEFTEQLVTLILALLIVVSALGEPVQGILLSLPIIALLIIGFASFGSIAASFFNNTKSYGAFTAFISPLVYLSGAFFPLESFPVPLRVIGLINPLTYGVDGLRATVIGTSTLGLPFDLVVLIPFAVGMFFLAWWLYEQREVRV
jgi:ABC-2 type transport system permease protein